MLDLYLILTPCWGAVNQLSEGKTPLPWPVPRRSWVKLTSRSAAMPLLYNPELPRFDSHDLSCYNLVRNLSAIEPKLNTPNPSVGGTGDAWLVG